MKLIRIMAGRDAGIAMTKCLAWTAPFAIASLVFTAIPENPALIQAKRAIYKSFKGSEFNLLEAPIIDNSFGCGSFDRLQ